MNKSLALVTALVLAFVPAGAVAKPRSKPKHRAHVYKATIHPVGADAAYTDVKFGKAQLVDGRKHDKLSVHLRHLAPGETYQVAVLQSAAEHPCEDPSGGTPAGTWTFKKPLTANPAGNVNGKAKSTDFESEPGTNYFVTVSTTGGDVIGCGELKGKKAKKAKKPKKGSKKQGKQGKGHK